LAILPWSFYRAAANWRTCARSRQRHKTNVEDAPSNGKRGNPMLLHEFNWKKEVLQASAGRFLGLVVSAVSGHEPDHRGAGEGFQGLQGERGNEPGIRRPVRHLLDAFDLQGRADCGVTSEATLRAEMER